VIAGNVDVEAAILRSCFLAAEMPLADVAGYIARFLEGGRDGFGRRARKPTA
jgi:hypothetical protein